ncbi:MAG: AMP-binding protein [Candidatus Hydrogenedens sp.]|nr:AMP-binding protein [Candidatus Hydrogenedens sp.]
MAVHPTISQAKTVPELFMARARLTPALVAYEYQDEEKIWHAVTYDEYAIQVKKAALGLHSFGIEKDSCVAIWGNTTPEWTVLDLGTLALGAHVAGIYQTCTPEQAAYIINDSRATVLCCDSPERLDSILEIREQIPNVVKFVVWSGQAQTEGDNYTTLDAVYEDGGRILKEQPELFDTMLTKVTPETYANLVYTSGTTGPPKGVVLSNGNCVAASVNACEHAPFFDDTDTTIAYLPLSHVAEYMGFLTRIICGVGAYFCDDFQKMPGTLTAKKPTALLGVPRVYEKVHQKIVQGVDNGSPAAKRIFHWAHDIGTRVVRLKEQKKAIPPALALQHAIADALVFSKVRARLGGNVRIMFTAAAPIDPRLIEFFMAFGIKFLEAYGLSETSGASHANLPEDFRIGTVGKPMRGVEQMIAEDGEILLRGDLIFTGYLNLPDATAEVIDADGWFHTGDIGEIDEDGFLRITDRKKNLLITAGGKNVAPAGIETLIKRETCVSQAVVIGDRQPFLTALIALSPDYVESEGLTEEAIKARIDRIIADTNTQVARYEQIKQYRIVPREFGIEEGEMTPTMKLKRNVIIKNWQHLVDEMYGAGEHTGSGKAETVNA